LGSILVLALQLSLGLSSTLFSSVPPPQQHLHAFPFPLACCNLSPSRHQKVEKVPSTNHQVPATLCNLLHSLVISVPLGTKSSSVPCSSTHPGVTD
jgi:hypothetical protein